MTEPSKDLNVHMARGSLWMVSMRWVLKVMGFVNVIILARLLVPEDFGLVAMAMILVGLVTTVTDGSFDKVVLRDPNSTPKTYDAAWTGQILAGGVATILIWAASPLLVSYFEEPRLYAVLLITGLRPFINGFENIGQVEFRRDFNFSKEFRYWVYRQSLGVAISLMLAFWLRNYFALALALPLGSLANVALSFLMSKYRPKLSFTNLRFVLSQSKWFAFLDTSRFFSDRLDELVVGRIASVDTMGHYYMASDVATMPTRELVMPLERSLMPTLAKAKDESHAMRDSLKLILAFVFSLCLSAGVGLYTIANDFVIIVLGLQWTPAIPFFEWLALYGIFSAFVISVQSFFVVSDRLQMYSYAYFAYTLVLVISLALVAFFADVSAVAPVRTFCMVGLAVLIAYLMQVERFISLRTVFSILHRPAVASFAMYFALRSLQTYQSETSILGLLAQIALGGCVYLSAQLLLWLVERGPDGAERVVSDWVRDSIAAMKS